MVGGFNQKVTPCNYIVLWQHSLYCFPSTLLRNIVLYFTLYLHTCSCMYIFHPTPCNTIKHTPIVLVQYILNFWSSQFFHLCLLSLIHFTTLQFIFRRDPRDSALGVDEDVLAAPDAGVQEAGPRPAQLRRPDPDVANIVKLGPGQRLVYHSLGYPALK